MPKVSPTLFQALQWRNIGPFRGGRSVAVVGHPTDPMTFYFGSTGGGVWKSNDGGNIWRNISDGFFKRASVGAIAVAESDPNVIYVGMGESQIRGNVSHGDGLYKSTDGGKSWSHLGLAETQNIAKVRIHPTNADVLYVAALGHVWGPNKERGIYRSVDGGKTFQQILFRSENAGAIDLSIDPTNPRILYAAFWEAQRYPHTMKSGGEESAIYKSVDGGDTWVEISRKPGLPKGVLGKIGIAVSPAQPDRVYAIIEAEEGGVYRSDDAGETWSYLNSDWDKRQRAWYYTNIIADPQDPNTCYVLNCQFFKSVDGGKTFSTIPMYHPDHHDLWIDPKNPNRMIMGNDGGATITFNGGESWSTQYNQPTAEMYHVTTDTRFPYRVYGAQQDNTTIMVASRDEKGGIHPGSYDEVGGGESGYIAVRPDNPNIVYAGSYAGINTRYDMQTRKAWDISVWPENNSGHGADRAKYRFQWTSPLHLSPHNPNVLYAAGNHLFRSTDEGASWEQISPDLTRNDPEKLGRSGGPITGDNTGAEYYCTIFAFAESPVQPGVLWTGSDDGLVQVSRDNGKSWTNVTPKELPEWALISIIEASPHDPGTAYVAATRYKSDDFRPYLLKTNDYGQSWTLITNGIPENDFTRVIREDQVRKGLLFAGTETGVYLSFDDGANWQPLKANLPVVPIHDLVIKEDDIVLGTHGRGFWIMDDISVLRQVSDSTLNAPARLFTPAPTVAVRMDSLIYFPDKGSRDYTNIGAQYAIVERKPDGSLQMVSAGQNPANGVYVDFYLKEAPTEPITLRFLDQAGSLIREFTGVAEVPAKVEGEKPFQAKAGGNRFIWDMRYPGPEEVPGLAQRGGKLNGPSAPPGTYQVELVVGGQKGRASFELRKDPRTETTEADLRAQFELQMQIREKISAVHRTATQVRQIKEQVQWWSRRAKEQGKDAGLAEVSEGLLAKLTALEEELIQAKAPTSTSFLHFGVRLGNKLVNLTNSIGGSERAPTKQHREVFADLSARVEKHLAYFQSLCNDDLAHFSSLVKAAGLEPVSLQAGSH